LFQALLDSLQELYPGCTVHGICRRPATQPPVFPAVRWHAALGGSYRQGIRRGLENATGLVLGLLEVGPSLLSTDPLAVVLAAGQGTPRGGSGYRLPRRIPGGLPQQHGDAPGASVPGAACLPKTRGVLSWLGLGDGVMDIEKIETESLYQRFQDAPAHPERFRAAQARARRLGRRGKAVLAGRLRRLVEKRSVAEP